MSDNEGHSGIFAMFQPDPKAIEQARMASETIRHDMRSLIDSLSAEQSQKLLNMLSIIENNQDMNSFFQGQIAAWLDLKHGKCVACGNDHDAVLNDMSGQPKVTERPAEEAFREQAETIAAQLKTFEVEPLEVGSEVVACIHCGSTFPSLADRMRRKPGKGGCNACIEKEKWG